MVHFERPEIKMKSSVVRSPQEIMAQRDADRAKIQEFKDAQAAIARGEVANVEEYYAKVDAERTRQQAADDESDERLLQLVRGVNQRTAERAAAVRAAEAAPVPVAEVAPVTPEIAPESEQSVEQSSEHSSEAERVAYAKAMRDAALAKQKRMIDDHARLAEERAKLRSLPSTPPPAPYLRVAEHRPEPMPKIDPFQKINIPGFGPAQILFVDADEDLMYFATPDERRRVDVQLSRDESQSSRNAADYSQVIRLTPTEVRRILTEQISMPPHASVGSLEDHPGVKDHAKHLKSRYAS